MFRTSVSRVGAGNVHVFLGSLKRWLRKGSFGFEIIAFLVRFVCWLMPLNRATVPNTWENLEPRAELRDSKVPLVLFSHGLTGTGDEHTLLAASLAADGHVVALCNHIDGSSSVTDIVCPIKGTEHVMFYRHPPSVKWDEVYSPDFRPKQVEQRASELEDARKLLLEGRFGKDLADIVDSQRVVVGGFSFGAATAAHVAASRPNDYKCCILWDGWFHVEYEGNRFDMPESAFFKGIPVPTLFLGSEQFSTYKNLDDATQRLAKKCPNSVYKRVAGTGHQSFCDAIFWLPISLLRKVKMVGAAEPVAAYVEILKDTRDFIDRNVNESVLMADTACSTRKR